jgi:hypothetical protein
MASQLKRCPRLSQATGERRKLRRRDAPGFTRCGLYFDAGSGLQDAHRQKSSICRRDSTLDSTRLSHAHCVSTASTDCLDCVTLDASTHCQSSHSLPIPVQLGLTNARVCQVSTLRRGLPKIRQHRPPCTHASIHPSDRAALIQISASETIKPQLRIIGTKT